MPLLWWVAYIVFGFVIWACAIAAVWIAVAEFFTALDDRRRRQRRARAADDLRFMKRLP